MGNNLMKIRDSGGTVRRFVGAEIEPERVVGLRPDHPAIVDGRSLFKRGVKSPAEVERIFVSGHNNPKLGARVTKGPWAGMPIYHLTLEERATCPTSCGHWSTCYGNAMPFARRHANDDTLIPVMKAELCYLGSKHPEGFVVRLHTLGDFYSMEYLEAWTDMIHLLPQLRIFGYTARCPNTDPIGMAIAAWTEVAWEVFAIRFSTGAPIPQGSSTFLKKPDDPHVLMCPAQAKLTEACATCGLCWAEPARQKTIGFLLHGMKASPFNGHRPSKALLGPRVRRAPGPVRLTAQDRLATVDQAERDRIAAAYGARFK